VALKDIEAAERPRERAARSGVASLSNRELMAALLGSGTSATDVLELAARLLAPGLERLAAATVGELMATAGLGLGQAARVAAAFELGRRRDGARGATRPLTTSRALTRFVRAHLRDEPQEVLLAVLLTSKLGVLRVVEVARGGAAGASFAPSDVLAPALREGAPRVALAHNHPSGDPTPSAADVDATARLAVAARTVGIDLVDHVIVGRRRAFSFADSGALRAKDARAARASLEASARGSRAPGGRARRVTRRG
jgi:DNA repair protein RadC